MWSSTSFDHIAMILTVTMNPCLDKSVVVHDPWSHGVHRAESVTVIAGGKGVNVARAASRLGAEVVAVVCVAGRSGQRLLDLIAADGVPSIPVVIEGETRTVTTILDANSTEHAQTSYVEPGARLNDNDAACVLAAVSDLMPDASVLVLTGPATSTASETVYGELVRRARVLGISTFVDSRGKAFDHAIEAGPTLVAPNVAEAAAWLGLTDLASQRDQIRAVRRLSSSGVDWVILTLGRGGAIAAVGDVVWRLWPPEIDEVNPVGSGDALVAGIACAWTNGEEVETVLRMGVAAGAANAAVSPACEISRESVDTLMGHVRMERLAEVEASHVSVPTIDGRTDGSA